jgi:hypothetical protein
MLAFSKNSLKAIGDGDKERERKRKEKNRVF